ncbi:hypothetical protein [Pseudomonas japonica]|uniref:hypothetical protein n=1 Tax=Pseudomonas japonica TaxID=256466 RepID=UPI0011300A9D|nr:hypothetical protein [Pseudomonas japonica]
MQRLVTSNAKDWSASMQVTGQVLGSFPSRAVRRLYEFGIVESFLRFVLSNFLSDAQRYGFDEHGIAQTPEYVEQEKQNSLP